VKYPKPQFSLYESAPSGKWKTRCRHSAVAFRPCSGSRVERDKAM